MGRKFKKTNPQLVDLIEKLKMYSAINKTVFWKDIAERLEKPSSKWPVVNVDKLEKYAKEGDYIIVPGKVLGDGILRKSIHVSAVQFSENAKKKIVAKGGECIPILKLVEVNPKGSGIKIIA